MSQNTSSFQVAAPSSWACIVVTMAIGFVSVAMTGLLRGAADGGTDADKLEGTWTVELVEKQGRKEPEARLKDMRVVIQAGVFEIKRGDKAGERATLKLDPSKQPRAIDLQPAPPSKEKRPSLGIYKLEGDTLTLCWRKEGGERPSEFATKAEDRESVLMILKREKK